MARPRKNTRSKKLKPAVKQLEGGSSKLLNPERKHVRFPTPPHTNSRKHLKNYSLTELYVVYQRLVHMEMLDDRTVG
ncbi:unnamed protein product, partial [Larinioides sclopetarius]